MANIAQTAQKFISGGAGAKGPSATVNTIRKSRLKSLRDPSNTGSTGLIFGPSGSGKTTSLVELAIGSADLPPQKVVYINADIGDGGYDSIRAHFKARNALDKLDNFRFIHVEDYEDGNAILDEFWDDPDIVQFDPDILAFEGMTTFLGIDLADYVLDNATTTDSSELRSAGLVFAKVGKGQEWEARKRGTVSFIDKFGRLPNGPSGKRLDKVITMFEGRVQKPKDPQNPTAGSTFEWDGQPLLSGYGVFDHFKGALTYLLKADVTTEAGKKKFTYVTAPGPKNREAKVRVVEFPDVIESDLRKVIARLREASDVGSA